ncbi:hypothetical protein PCE1_000481 [Barthelona sp. PCE]
MYTTAPSRYPEPEQTPLVSQPAVIETHHHHHKKKSGCCCCCSCSFCGWFWCLICTLLSLSLLIGIIGLAGILGKERICRGVDQELAISRVFPFNGTMDLDLEIALIGGSINIVRTANPYVAVRGVDKYTLESLIDIKLENGILNIAHDHVSFFNTKSCALANLTIEIPSSVVIRKLFVGMGINPLSEEGVVIGDIFSVPTTGPIDIALGDIPLKTATLNSNHAVNVGTGYGSIEISEIICTGDVRVNIGMGDVDIGKFSSPDMKVNIGDGNFNLNNIDGMDSFKFKVNYGRGSFTYPDAVIITEDNDKSYEGYYVDENSSNNLKANIGHGDITF